MPRTTIPIIGQESDSRSKFSADAQVTRNWTVTGGAPGAKAPVMLESVPGAVELGAIGDGPCRSPRMITWRGDMYGVFGTQWVRITKASGPVVVGTLGTSTGRVEMARGRSHIMVVDGARGYTYDGTTFAVIDDVDFPDERTSRRPTHVVYLDSYFIVNDATTDFFFLSGIENPREWNALDFEAAAVSPDKALALAATESELWVIGDGTAQAYYNSGNPLFPFSIILGATQEVGIAAPHSLAESDLGIYYLATMSPEGGRFVYRIQGHGGQKVSSTSIDEQIARAGDTDSAYGFIYSQEGLSYYVLQLNDNAPTLVYNLTAGTWETRALPDDTAWRIAGMGVLGQQTIGGSRFAGRFYDIRKDVYQDAGTPIVRRRVTQVQHAHNRLIDWWELVVDTATVGVSAGDDPQLRLRYSDDGGNSWSAQLLQPLGRVGEAFRRAVFRNLGFSRQRIFELEVSDNVGVTIISAYAKIELLAD